MKSFLKYVFATITGILILIALLGMILMGVLSSMSQKKEVTIDNNSVLHLKLDYPLNDRTSDDLMGLLGILSDDLERPVGLTDLIEQIEYAKTDDHIKGIFLDLYMLNAGYAKISELRDALIDFRESGKFVYAYSDLYTNKTYYLASAADSVFLNPKGTFIFNGMVADVTFIREAMEKLGIELQPIKRGKYKGAVEPFVMDSLSTSNREQISAYLHSIYNEAIKGMAEQRHMDVALIDSFADHMLVKNPTEAKSRGLVDNLIYRDQMFGLINMQLDKEQESKISFVKPGKYAGTMHAGHHGKDRIAVVYADGSIVNGNGDRNEIGGDRFAETLREIRNDDGIKAVVLRINSGGGSALASEIIWREAELLRKKKPLIVSMGDVAASGGYYIACMADTIVALPSTLTGSIGVFGLYPNLDKLLNYIGVRTDFVGTGERSDFGRVDRKLSDADFAVIDSLVGGVYRSFLERVSEGRSMSLANVDSIAQGRVWTGEMALDIGLVDVLGGFEDALNIAAAKAGLEEYQLVSYPKQKNKLDEIFSLIDAEQAQAKQDFLKSELGDSYRYYELLKMATNLEGVQAMMPYTVTIQ